jgi:hypothetical protein
MSASDVECRPPANQTSHNVFEQTIWPPHRRMRRRRCAEYLQADLHEDDVAFLLGLEDQPLQPFTSVAGCSISALAPRYCGGLMWSDFGRPENSGVRHRRSAPVRDLDAVLQADHHGLWEPFLAASDY